MNKNKKMANLCIVLGLIFGVLVAICAAGYNYYSNLDNDENEKKATNERLAIKKTVENKTDEIIKNQKSTANSSKKNKNEIISQIKSIKKNDNPNIRIQNSPNSTIQINENGDNIINQIKEEYKPKMKFFDKEIKIEKTNNSELIKTTFYFGSEDGLSILNPIVDITFKTKFMEVFGGVTGSGMVSAGNLSKETLEDNKRFIIRTNILQAGNYFFIETLTKNELQIENLKINPQ